MKEINFIDIHVEGFGAMQFPFHFEFNNPGINIFRGENGTCKTTLFSALVWALYGINLKGVDKERVATWPHVRTGEFKGTRVMVRYETEGVKYTVIRHINYKGKTYEKTGGNTMMVFINEELKSTGIQDSTKLVEESLGLNSKMFLNSVLFGQRMKKLIESTDEDKRKVFDELFDAEWVGKARENAKAQVDKYTKLLNANIKTLEELIFIQNQTNESLRSLQEAKEKFNLDRVTSRNTQESALEDSENYLKTIENTLEELGEPEGVGKIDQATAEVNRIKPLLDSLNLTLKGKQEALAKHDKLIEQTKSAIQSMELRLKEYRINKDSFDEKKGVRIASYQKAVEDLSDNIDSIYAILKELGGTKERDFEANGVTLELPNDYERVKDNNSVLEGNMKGVEGEMAKFQNSLSTLAGEIEVLTQHATSGTCFNCGGPLKSEVTLEQISDKKKVMADVQEQLDDRLIELKGIKKSLDESKTQLQYIEELMEVYPQYSKILSDIRENEEKLKIKVSDKMQLEALMEETKKSTWDTPTPCTDQDIEDKRKTLSTLIEQRNGYEDEVNQADLEYNEKGVKALQEWNDYLLFATQKNAEITKWRDLQNNTLSSILTLKESIASIDTQEFPLEGDIHNGVLKLEDIKVKYNEAQTLGHYYDEEVKDYTYWLNAFGSTGVKAFIFESMLSLLNASMEQYATQLGVRVKFSIDFNSARKGVVTQCFKDGGVVLYDDLSGGEKQRVDVVQVFGVHDIVETGKVLVNIMIMDEIFENLDQEGIEAVFNLIRMKLKGNRSIYLITHLPEMDTTFARVFNFNRIGGLTVVN